MRKFIVLICGLIFASAITGTNACPGGIVECPFNLINDKLPTDEVSTDGFDTKLNFNDDDKKSNCIMENSSCQIPEGNAGNSLLDEECSICLENYHPRKTKFLWWEFTRENPRVQMTNCQHHFHRDCISKWMLNNSKCPNCRAPTKPRSLGSWLQTKRHIISRKKLRIQLIQDDLNLMKSGDIDYLARVNLLIEQADQLRIYFDEIFGYVNDPAWHFSSKEFQKKYAHVSNIFGYQAAVVLLKSAEIGSARSTRFLDEYSTFLNQIRDELQKSVNEKDRKRVYKQANRLFIDYELEKVDLMYRAETILDDCLLHVGDFERRVFQKLLNQNKLSLLQ